MAKLLVELSAIPAVISDSVRCCLKAHGLSLSEPVLVELGRNAAQALTSIDETPVESDDVEPLTRTAPAGVGPIGREITSQYFLRPCIWCGHTHRFTSDADDLEKCPNCAADLSPVATRFEEFVER